MVEIMSMEWTGTAWLVFATIITDRASRAGSYVLDLPESATAEDIKAALIELNE